MTNRDKLALLWKELESWMDGNDQNGSLEFAFRNGFTLHAISIWYGSGASQYNFPIRISRQKELAEIKQLCAYADIFICPHCNHHSFFQPNEIEDDEIECESCLKIMKVHTRGK